MIRRVDLRSQIEAAARDTSDGPCLRLTGKVGRPVVRFNGKHTWASRAVWTLANGDPGSLFVLHTCAEGASGCVRLAHLYLGTAADNARDRAADGNNAIGERNAAAKLTRDDVQEIRRLLAAGLTQAVIGARFGVSHFTISDIKTRKSWGWLPAEVDAA